MNRVLLLLSLIIMSVSGWTQSSVISIGSGNYSNNGSVPINTYYNYSASQTIYLSSEIADTGSIMAISYRGTDATINTSRNIKVYMATTQLSQFSSNSDALPLSNFTLVYQGPYSIVGGQWSQIQLTTPFHYDGTQNLVIGVEDYTNTWSFTVPWQSTQATGRSMYDYDDYDAVTVDGLTYARVVDYHPDIELYISADGSFCTQVTGVVASDITTSSATVSWAERDDASTFYYQVKKAQDSWVEGDDETVSDNSIDLDDLDPATIYNVRIKADCGNGQSSYTVFTFTTSCGVISALPWTTNFDAEPAYSRPTCWKVLNPYYDWPAVNSDTYDSYSGTNSFKFSSNSTRSIAILPAFETSLNQLQLSFYTKREGTNSGTFYIGYITDTADANSFVTIDSMTAASIGDNNYHLYEVSYANVEIDDDTVSPRMAFAYLDNSGTSWYWFVDDVTVGQLPACTRPGQISHSVTAQTSTISWNSTGTNFEVYYKEIDSANYRVATNFTSAETSGSYTISLENLIPNTEYSYYIKVICDDTLSSEVKTFKTECLALDSIPITWDFETYDYELGIPACWSNNHVSDYGGFGAYVTDNYSVSGNYSLFISNGTTFLPPIDSSISINELQLRFQALAPHLSYYGASTLQVGVMTDVNDASTFEVISNVDINSDIFSEKIVLFANYEGEGTHICIRKSSGQYAVIEDVTLEFIPDCPPVQSIVATTITSDSIAFTWTGTNDSYFVRYKASGETQWSTQNLTINGASATISGLSANTDYIVSIAPDCDETTEETYREATFTTTCTPYDVPYFMNFEDEGLFNCWTVAAEFEDYSYSYPYISNTPSLANSPYNSFVLGGDNTGSLMVAAPKVNLNIEQTRLQFSIRKNELTSAWGSTLLFGNVEIGLMTAPSDTSTFVSLYAVADSTITTTYSVQTIDFNQFTQYTGNNYYIAIRYKGIAGEYSYADGELLIDDIKIDKIPSCSEATNLVANNATTNSVDISWSSEATNFKIYYKPASSTDEYQSVDATLTSGVYTLQNLTPATPYVFYIATVCSDNTESNSNISTFTTECGTLSVPYTMNFENVTLNQRPLCWSFINNTTEEEVVYPCVTDGRYSGHASSKGLEFHSDSDTSIAAVAIMPAFTESLNNLSVEFWTRPESDPASNYYSSGRLDIGYVTDPTNANTFVTVETIDVYNLEDNDYHRYRVDFDSVTLDDNATGYIAFRHVPNVDYYYWYLDDVTVENIPACSSPVNLVVSNKTANSVDLSWRATENSLTLYYKRDTASTYDSIENVTLDENGVYTLENLQPNTKYDWMVGYACYLDNQIYSSEVLSFRTACGMITELPQTWGFEASDNTAGSASMPLPSCWQRVDANYPYSYNSTTPHSGSYCLYFNTKGNIGILPQVDTETLPINTLQLSFYARSYYSDTLKVGVMTDPTDATTFVDVASFILTNNFTLYEAPLTLYAGSGSYIAFKNAASSTYRTQYVDDVTLSLAPACTTPSDISVTATADQATVTWTSTGSSFEVYYKESTATDYNTPITTVMAGEVSNVYSVTISDLESSTVYNLYIKAICNEESQPQSQVVTFSTECNAVTTFPYTEDFESLTTDNLGCWTTEVVSGTYNWTIMSTTGSNKYAYKDYNSGNTYLISPVFDITSLDSPTLSYDWEVHSDGSYFDSLHVCYRANSTDAWTVLVSHGPNTSGAFNAITQSNTVSLPSASTHYQIAFLAACHWGYGVGVDNVVISDGGSVVTPVEPTVATNVASNISQTSATLNGEITDAGNQTITAKGFEWKATNGGTYAQVLSADNGNTLTYNLTNLTANTSYTYKAFASTANGTVYGSEQVFTTLSSGDEPCTPLTASVTETLCYGESFTFNGQTYNATGTYTTTVAGQNGDCDTNYTINLTILPQNTASVTETLCYGESFTFNGQTYNATGTYTTTVAGQNGDCDTLYTINLTILPQNTASITETLCYGESFTFNGQTYEATTVGTYTTTVTVAGQNGDCDTLYTVSVTILPQNEPINEEITISQSELPYEYHGETYNDFGTYSVTTQDENGCDQVYNLTLVHNSGISEVEGGLTISLYPNPTDNNATLRVKGLNEQATIIITDQQGRVVSTKVLAEGVETMEIESEKLASGVYYIRIQTATTIRTEKLIKK